MRPGQQLTTALGLADTKGVDGLVSGVAAAVSGLSTRVRRLQTGFVAFLRAVDVRRRAHLLVAIMMVVRVW